MFYTDTNGQLPIFCSKALVVLGIAMESTPLDKIDFEVFKEIDPVRDSEMLDLFENAEAVRTISKNNILRICKALN